MKFFYLLFVILLVIVSILVILPALASATVQAAPERDSIYEPYRYVDAEYGVVCYIVSRAIDCVFVGE